MAELAEHPVVVVVVVQRKGVLQIRVLVETVALVVFTSLHITKVFFK